MGDTAHPVVVSIVADTVRPGHARVQVGDVIYTVDALVVSELRLQRGRQLDDDVLAALQTAADVTKAKQWALSLLAQRAYTRHEIDGRLQRRDYDALCRTQVVEWLTELGYIDDRAYAARWVETRSEGKSFGPRRLRQELRRKGVDDAFIEAALSLRGEAYYVEQAYKVAYTRWRRHEAGADLTPQVVQRLTGFLQRRGFEAGTVYRVLRRLKDEFPA